MYPLSSMMTPDPDPDCDCDGAAGTPLVKIVTTDGRTFATTAGTERDFSWGATALEPGSAPAHDEENNWRRPHIQTRNDVPKSQREIVLSIDDLLWHKSFTE
jgi:hypothetical protein